MRQLVIITCVAMLALSSIAYAQTEQSDKTAEVNNRPPNRPAESSPPESKPQNNSPPTVKPDHKAALNAEDSAPGRKPGSAVDGYAIGKKLPDDGAQPEDAPKTDSYPISDDAKPDDNAESKDDVTEDKDKKPKIPETPEWIKLRETDQEYAACRLALSLLGTKYEEIPAITSPEDEHCGIARPIRVSEIIPGVELQGGAEMRCDTARALGFWTRDFVRPATAVLPDAPQLTGYQLGSTYSCRPRIGTGEERPKLSQHGLGNAIDIAAFEFDNGESIAIEPRKDTGNIIEGFQRSAQSTACLFFSTVLGPGSNATHNNHLHLDVDARKNGWRLCE